MLNLIPVGQKTLSKRRIDVANIRAFKLRDASFMQIGQALYVDRPKLNARYRLKA